MKYKLLLFVTLNFFFGFEELYSQGEQELLDAVYNNDEKKVFYLLKGGINPNITSEEGVTPLMYASDTGNLYMCKILIKNGVNIGTINEL